MHIIKQLVYNGDHKNLCVYIYWFAYKYNNIVETPKPVMKVICQGMAIGMGTGCIKERVEERQALPVYHFLFSSL